MVHILLSFKALLNDVISKLQEICLQMATPISVEPCSNYRSGVFTLAVRLPTGGRQFTPHGTSGLAVASALCLLTQAQLGVLQAAETSDANHNRKTTLMRYIPFIRS